jgi:hypothetical protein
VWAVLLRFPKARYSDSRRATQYLKVEGRQTGGRIASSVLRETVATAPIFFRDLDKALQALLAIVSELVDTGRDRELAVGVGPRMNFHSAPEPVAGLGSHRASIVRSGNERDDM